MVVNEVSHIMVFARIAAVKVYLYDESIHDL